MTVSLLRTVRAESWNPGLRFFEGMRALRPGSRFTPSQYFKSPLPLQNLAKQSVIILHYYQEFRTNQSIPKISRCNPSPLAPSALLPVSISSHCPFNNPLRLIPGPLLSGVFRSANPTAWVRGPAPTPETAGVSPGPRRHHLHSRKNSLKIYPRTQLITLFTESIKKVTIWGAEPIFC